MLDVVDLLDEVDVLDLGSWGGVVVRSEVAFGKWGVILV